MIVRLLNTIESVVLSYFLILNAMETLPHNKSIDLVCPLETSKIVECPSWTKIVLVFWLRSVAKKVPILLETAVVSLLHRCPPIPSSRQTKSGCSFVGTQNPRSQEHRLSENEDGLHVQALFGWGDHHWNERDELFVLVVCLVI